MLDLTIFSRYFINVFDNNIDDIRYFINKLSSIFSNYLGAFLWFWWKYCQEIIIKIGTYFCKNTYCVKIEWFNFH